MGSWSRLSARFDPKTPAPALRIMMTAMQPFLSEDAEDDFHQDLRLYVAPTGTVSKGTLH